MPTKLDAKKLLREMVDFKRGPTVKKNLTLNMERFERFQAAVEPGSGSEVLDYLMECVIRGSKAMKGKK